MAEKHSVRVATVEALRHHIAPTFRLEVEQRDDGVVGRVYSDEPDGRTLGLRLDVPDANWPADLPAHRLPLIGRLIEDAFRRAREKRSAARG